jgi:hypothetical protein
VTVAGSMSTSAATSKSTLDMDILHNESCLGVSRNSLTAEVW